MIQVDNGEEGVVLKVKVLGDLEEQILGFICGGEQKCGECA